MSKSRTNQKPMPRTTKQTPPKVEECVDQEVEYTEPEYVVSKRALAAQSRATAVAIADSSFEDVMFVNNGSPLFSITSFPPEHRKVVREILQRGIREAFGEISNHFDNLFNAESRVKRLQERHDRGDSDECVKQSSY